MGLYDTIHHDGHAYQFKALDCMMVDYYVRDGRLVKPVYDMSPGEWADERELIGERDMDYHGMIYAYGGDPARDVAFKFTDGVLVELRDVADTPEAGHT